MLIAAQVLGGVAGAVVANLMFDLDPITISTHDRTGGGLWLGEVVATLGLVVVIFGSVRTGVRTRSRFAVGGYITAAYWFTSSTSFANPAVTIARMFSDTFAGIAPASVPGSCSPSSSAARSPPCWFATCPRPTTTRPRS